MQQQKSRDCNTAHSVSRDRPAKVNFFSFLFLRLKTEKRRRKILIRLPVLDGQVYTTTRERERAIPDGPSSIISQP